MDGASIVGKRGSLSTFAAEKPGAARPAEQEKPEKEKQRGQTLRLNVRAWEQLKTLALKRRAPSHDLLIEAVNDLFQKYGEPPIA
jgi:hypothetical protein